MIIACEKCGTKYRFDESLIVGEGIWVRCSRCKSVFFQENPSQERVVPPFEVVEEREAVSPEMKEGVAEQEIDKEIPDFDDLLEEKETVDTEIEETPEQEIDKEIPDFDDLLEEKETVDTEIEEIAEEEIETEDDKDRKKRKKRLWTPGKVLAYILIVILVLGGVYIWLFPQIGEQVLDKVSHYISIDKLGKKDKSTDVKVGSVNFIDVKERFTKNWILGDLLVIQGIVVNKYEYPISRVKVRGKILNAAGEVLDKVESYCGNLLTDEELGNLTEKEIAEELSIQIGSD
ncbi:MAG: zinc-ribbon domain-containing protein, partial [Thermodesulfobacteriota bacterium]|nr:zinc-ribbon domain-containing protein [Thermodesulfobacteriota bacterium]